jgi:3-phenylpropionate/trans-cinnamate dioxygenase ferredoxin reductase subunit
MSQPTFVIIGASLAGAKAAAELREQGFDGRILLIGSETHLPYERPPLSKDLLQGKAKPADAQVFDESFYGEHDITLLSGVTATALDPGGRTVDLDSGDRVAYDALLLSTGSRPRVLEVPGSELDGVFYLRPIDDSEALAQRLGAGGRLVVVGGGWIGSEVAASARGLGAEVTIVDPTPLPNQRIFGTEIGQFYADVHAAHGVTLHFQDGVAALEGAGGAVTGVRTESGARLPADYVVVGVGAAPRVELAQTAGITVDNGILVDAALRTSADGVFAAGDVARAENPFYGERIRVEHWSNALNQGPAAARSMLGQAVSYDRIPYFFSDQYDVGMEYSGYATSWDEVVFRGDRDAGEFVAFWLAGGRVLAGMNVNVWDVNEHIRTLIRSRAKVDIADLTDPSVSLESLAGSTRTDGPA